MSDASLMGSAYNPLWLGDIVTDFHCNQLGMNCMKKALDQNLIEVIIVPHVECGYIRQLLVTICTMEVPSRPVAFCSLALSYFYLIRWAGPWKVAEVGWKEEEQTWKEGKYEG